ncbi:MAG: polysaccharide biosynthesis protein [Oscillospiraceae bacterium]|nr:polysaccharide biosynthesis protein [Oscillospiraceae bacterium]
MGILQRIAQLSSCVKKAIIIAYDVLVIQLAAFLALWIRFEFSATAIPSIYTNNYIRYAIINTVVTIALFVLFKLYGSLWLFAGSAELLNILSACALSAALAVIGFSLFSFEMPRSFFVLYFGFLLAGATGIRVYYRLRRHLHRRFHLWASRAKRIMLIGAGEAGNLILKEIMDNESIDGNVVCCVDDDPGKKGKYLCGVKIIGGKHLIPEAARKNRIDEIVVAIPSASPKEVSEILEICKHTGCKTKILPGIYKLMDGETKFAQLRDVQIEDLLGREPIKVNSDEITEYNKGKVILVTGGGGSIGSELCRQLARSDPKLLIIVDIYENNAFDIQQELLRDFPELSLEVLIASIRDVSRMREIFEQYHPDIVYHAAAHKHVPLMEQSPNEAIKNNVFGTLNVVRAAGENGVKRFVLISSDKAVNPTNIMGASKRICEMIVQMMNGVYQTEYVVVRFGNVLGSNGSVIPHFIKQIATGGPVTVTHKDIIRYFMTIREAVSLVLQAGVYADGGEVFILDMGEPVRIDDLARNLIRLYGFVPDVDIDIVYTGLRPGEKLFEEILLTAEGLRMTNNKLIYVANPIEFDGVVFYDELEELRRLVVSNEDVRQKTFEIINKPRLDAACVEGYIFDGEEDILNNQYEVGKLKHKELIPT